MLPSTLVSSYNTKAPFDGNAQAQQGLAGNAPALGYDLHRSYNVVAGVYDFAVQGGASGTIKLNDDQGNPIIFPANCIINKVAVLVQTAPTSGGSATVAFGSGASTADLLAATAKTSLTSSLFTDGVPTGASSTAVNLTSSSQMSVTIAAAALTAGKFKVFAWYLLY